MALVRPLESFYHKAIPQMMSYGRTTILHTSVVESDVRNTVVSVSWAVDDARRSFLHLLDRSPHRSPIIVPTITQLPSRLSWSPLSLNCSESLFGVNPRQWFVQKSQQSSQFACCARLPPSWALSHPQGLPCSINNLLKKKPSTSPCLWAAPRQWEQVPKPRQMPKKPKRMLFMARKLSWLSNKVDLLIPTPTAC